MSCSIKEDRMPCPGYLEIGLDSCRPLTGGTQLWGWNEDGTIFDKRVDISQSSGNMAAFSVPKGEFNYCLWFGLKDWKEHVRNHVYTIPLGKEADPLYASPVHGLLMSGEFLRDEAVPHRQHCVLTVVMSGLSQERMQGLLLSIRSGTSGISLADLSPVQGEFLVTGVPDKDGKLSFTLIRQGFGDLKASLFDNGKLAATYDLTAILDSIGYDWAAEDLSDVTVEFSVSTPSAAIVMRPWDDGGTLAPEA